MKETLTKRGAMVSKYVWLVAPSWGALHYIPALDDRDDNLSGNAFWLGYWDEVDGPASLLSACGLRRQWQLPGWFSRMGAPRCRHCCRVLGIPPGDGAPVNDHSLDSLRAQPPVSESR